MNKIRTLKKKVCVSSVNTEHDGKNCIDKNSLLKTDKYRKIYNNTEFQKIEYSVFVENMKNLEFFVQGL